MGKNNLSDAIFYFREWKINRADDDFDEMVCSSRLMTSAEMDLFIDYVRHHGFYISFQYNTFLGMENQSRRFLQDSGMLLSLRLKPKERKR